jgi:type I restriction enzyme S subunit
MELNEPSAKYLVRVGYQQSEVGQIPVSWTVRSIKELAPLQRGFDLPNGKREDGPFPVVYSNGSVATHIEAAVSGPGVVTGRSGTIGRVHYIEGDYWPHNTSLWVTRFQNCDPRFIFHLYSFARFDRFSSGSGVPTLNRNDLHSHRLAVPTTLDEQRAIAIALTDADALIESLEQLLAKKRQIKQGAMQELLTGQRRLPGFQAEWCTVSLGEIGTFLKGSGITREQAQSGAIPCVRYGEIYTTHTDHVRSFESGISPAVAATATPLRQGDILFAGSGETKEDIGKCVAFLDDFEAYAGGDIVILRPRGFDSRYLGYALNAAEVNRQKASKGQGDAVVHISAAALAQISVRAPEIAEQTAIATILSDIDTEITALEARLTKARQLKQGMAQALLTGRIRLV